MTLVSASGVERQLACPGSGHLPQADYRTPDAEAGNARHEDAEIAALIGDLDGLPWQVRKLLEPGDVFAAECALAYDVSDDTARALGHIKWRDYQGLGPFEIPMTLDLVIYGERRILYVDYKGYEDATTAAHNAQLLTGALAIARDTGRYEIMVAIVYLGAAWRPADVATLSVFDLDIHAARLRDMVSSQDRTLNVGPWCKYCHAFVAVDGQILCPEQRALAKQAEGGELAVRIEAMIPFERDEDARAAFEMRDRIALLLKRVDAALYARAAARPIPLGKDRMFGRHTRLGKREYDGRKVHEVVAKRFGRDVADRVVEMESTQVRFKEVVQPIVKRGKYETTRKEVFDEVEALGGLTRKTLTSVIEYDAGPHLVTDESEAKTLPVQIPEDQLPF